MLYKKKNMHSVYLNALNKNRGCALLLVRKTTGSNTQPLFFSIFTVAPDIPSVFFAKTSCQLFALCYNRGAQKQSVDLDQILLKTHHCFYLSAPANSVNVFIWLILLSIAHPVVI